MSYHQFGRISSERLMTCHPDLIAIMKLAIGRSRVDFGIAQGARTWEDQLNYYQQGKSKLDPRIEANKERAKHVVGSGWRKLSAAADIYIYHPNDELRRKLAYDRSSLAYVAGVICSCAEELHQCGEVLHKVRWGGNWDKDGVILMDQTFQDLPHFEIYIPKQ